MQELLRHYRMHFYLSRCDFDYPTNSVKAINGYTITKAFIKIMDIIGDYRFYS